MVHEEKIDMILKNLKELKEQVSHIEEILSTKKSEPLLTGHSIDIPKGESFMEFFNKFYLQNDTDKALVIMSFLESRKSIKNITTKNISEGFREVREKIPSNVADKIQMLHKKGYIMPGETVENLKGWLITRTGLEYLEELRNGKDK
jgi:hypothetical protein